MLEHARARPPALGGLLLDHRRLRGARPRPADAARPLRLRRLLQRRRCGRSTSPTPPPTRPSASPSAASARSARTPAGGSSRSRSTAPCTGSPTARRRPAAPARPCRRTAWRAASPLAWPATAREPHHALAARRRGMPRDDLRSRAQQVHKLPAHDQAVRRRQAHERECGSPSAAPAGPRSPAAAPLTARRDPARDRRPVRQSQDAQPRLPHQALGPRTALRRIAGAVRVVADGARQALAYWWYV